MSELVVAPDIEAALIHYLNAAFAERQDRATAATEIPDPRPDRLVRLSRAGGSRRNALVDSPVIIFEAWDVDSVRASELGRLTEALVAAADGTWIGSPAVWVNDIASVGGLTYFPDPDTALPRYQFTLQLFTNCEVH